MIRLVTRRNVWGARRGLFALSVALPATGGGWLWLLPAIMIPLLAAWAIAQITIIARGESLRIRGRTPLRAIVACTAIAVAGFCAVVAYAFQY